ncbi:MAG: hypothetical protein RLZZ584_1991, partial [Pseudomonadota bacterium]
TPGAPRYKAVGTWLRWRDREGVAHELALASLIGSLDPYWSGAVLVAAGDGGMSADDVDQMPARHPGLPPDAASLADGRLAWKVAPASDLAWLFDRRSGRLTARCSGNAGLAGTALSADSLGSCAALSGMVVWGVVRFSTSSLTPGSAEAAEPPSAALDLDLRVTLSSTGHPTPGWECEDNSAAAVAAAQQPGAVRYLCIVQPAGTSLRWSGRLDVVPLGWQIGSAAAEAMRVGNGRTDNAEHPAAYVDVDAPLGNQNFLVVPLVASCPVDTPAAPGSAGISTGLPLADYSTRAHQP